jgi:hypothetical protein
MLDLFDIVKGDPIIKVSSLYIPELKRIWDADTDPDKINATQKLVFLYHYTQPSSAYASLPDATRLEQCKQAFLLGTDIDLELQNAIDTIKAGRSATELLHESAKNGMYKIARYLDETDINNESINKMLSTIRGIPEIIEVGSKTTKALEEDMRKAGKKVGFKSDILTDHNIDEDEDW